MTWPKIRSYYNAKNLNDRSVCSTFTRSTKNGIFQLAGSITKSIQLSRLLEGSNGPKIYITSAHFETKKKRRKKNKNEVKDESIDAIK